MGQVLAFIPRRHAPKATFGVLLYRQSEARCFYEWTMAVSRRERAEGLREDLNFAATGEAFDAWVAATIRMVACPAESHEQLRAKKSALGVWLKAEGKLYDQYREFVAIDEANLGPAKRRGRA